MSIPVIAFVGHHHAGKTDLVTQVINHLSLAGLRVGSVKHHGASDRYLDVPDSDTWQHANAGSCHALMVASTGVAEYRKVDVEPTFEQVVGRLGDVDIVIVEGYKKAGVPSFAVANSRVDSYGTLRTLLTGSTVAVVCDDPLATIVPDDLRRYRPDDVDGICALVREVAAAA